MIYVGAAIYNSAAYFNHSCSPDVIRYFVGTSIVICASHPLQPDDTISENYGPIYTKQPLQLRKRNLQSRYWFDCTCICCTENWPTLDKLKNKPRLRFAFFKANVGSKLTSLFLFIRCTNSTNSKCSHLFAYPEKSKKSVKCPECKDITNLEVQIATLKTAEDHYRAAAECMDREELKAAAELFTNGINLFFSVATPPHRDTHIAQESLRICLSNIGRL